MAFFYARESEQGLNHICQNSDGTIDRLPGTILRFPSRAERDSYVAADPGRVDDGSPTREAIRRAQIEPIMRHVDRWGIHSWVRHKSDSPEVLDYV